MKKIKVGILHPPETASKVNAESILSVTSKVVSFYRPVFKFEDRTVYDVVVPTHDGVYYTRFAECPLYQAVSPIVRRLFPYSLAVLFTDVRIFRLNDDKEMGGLASPDRNHVIVQYKDGKSRLNIKLIHEFGHIVGLPDCFSDEDCVMDPYHGNKLKFCPEHDKLLKELLAG